MANGRRETGDVVKLSFEGRSAPKYNLGTKGTRWTRSRIAIHESPVTIHDLRAAGGEEIVAASSRRADVEP
jgi:hypothetical protein